MQKQPLISIITPTYNHERFIGQCIESVLAQTYPHWEQIIIDDGSTDRTGEIVAGYKDERIKYIRQDNVGIWKLAETYNKALQISEGELIAVLEGDDFWPPYKLEKQMPVFERENVVLSWGKVAITNDKGKTFWIGPKNLKWFKNRTRQQVLRKLLFANPIQPCTVMCRKDALLSIGGFKQPECSPYVDYPTWLELSLVGELYPVDEILGCWRRHKDQISTTKIMQMAEARHRCSMAFFERLPQEQKNSLGISSYELLNRGQYDIAAAHFTLGRINLIQGKWDKARKNLRQALDRGTLSTKIKALLGIACSYLKLDLEWAALLMRRPRLSRFL
jgi:glycosyltransferase involved in cell wall biosynthesis